MQETDINVYGRKVFFVNPHFTIRLKLLHSLAEDEYEVYVLSNVKKLHGLLKEYPNSMLYINVDEGNTHEGWLEYIEALEGDKSLLNILVGVMTSTLIDSQKKDYIEKAKLEGGLIDLSNSKANPIAVIKSILIDKNAKGRRQYLRCNCANVEANNYAIIKYENKGYHLKLIDVSVAGVTLQISDDNKDVFQDRSILRNIFITLDNIDFTHPMVVFGQKRLGDINVLILLFLPGLSDTIKAQIHKYITRVFDKRLKDMLADIPNDA